MVAMPNLINLPKRQAILLVESSGLEIGQLKYQPDLSIDVVIDQHYNGKKIQEGDSLQKGSVVDLVLGKGLSNQRTLCHILLACASILQKIKYSPHRSTWVLLFTTTQYTEQLRYS